MQIILWKVWIFMYTVLKKMGKDPIWKFIFDIIWIN